MDTYGHFLENFWAALQELLGSFWWTTRANLCCFRATFKKSLGSCRATFGFSPRKLEQFCDEDLDYFRGFLKSFMELLFRTFVGKLMQM